MPSLLRDFIDFSTFSSIWYWLFLALAWSSRTHWTIGAPFDAVIRADKRGGKWEDDLDAAAGDGPCDFERKPRDGGHG